jgi:glycosyltransferase involved in cell wall biosynthesis
MNIVITIDELDMGGAQHLVYELVKNIDTLKYNITIICTDGKVDSLLEREMLENSSKNNYRIVFLPKTLLSYISTPSKIFNKIAKRLLRLPSELLIIPSLCHEVKKSKPDIVHAHQHGILAAYWTLFHNIPMITTVHTNPKVTFYRECEKIAFKLSVLFKKNIFVAISKYNLELIRNYWHLDDKNSRCVNNGIDLAGYYQKPHEVFTFINVSRQDINKNQSLILRALARLHREETTIPMKLYLVGGGDTHETLKSEASELGISSLVEFTGYIASAREYLTLSDVYISSSHREGLPLSVLEAMASKLPIIATDAGGVRDLAQENGILIADDDEEGLCAAMKKLRDDTELRQMKANKSLEMVQAYSATAMAKGYASLYDEFANKT